MTKKPPSKTHLNDLQFDVTQCGGTEAPFQNEYWDNKKEGIYVDIVSGEVLFSSQHKYDSNTGWPSFYQPLEPSNLVFKEDHSLSRKRTEVRSKHADSHLGHVFDDGPKPTNKRYCMNSAAMRFIPKEALTEEGYGEYRSLFDHWSVAYLAGGCFWCGESDFLQLPGVKNVESGYMGGHIKDPTYEEVSTGTSGHAEIIRVTFDENEISYDDVLKFFWLNIDPTTKNRQFCDVGTQYRSAIFYVDEKQKHAATESVQWLSKLFPHVNIVTELTPAQEFFLAEDYHQRFFKKQPERYQQYRQGCGRDERLKELFGDEREEILSVLLKARGEL